jgi:hypothetical protein
MADYERGVYQSAFGDFVELTAVAATGRILRRVTIMADLDDEVGRDIESMQDFLARVDPIPCPVRLVAGVKPAGRRNAGRRSAAGRAAGATD